MATAGSSTHHVVISADGHAGADLLDYRPYLEERWLDEFDAWAAAYANPFDDLRDADAERNWNSERRLAELEADGIVAEVLFPNTIPPFFPSGSLIMNVPTPDEYQRRWAGIRAHNRWLVDFCAAAPGRRAGIAQLLINDIDDALDEIRWAKDHGLTGGILVPGVPPGSSTVPQLASEVYEPIWALCAELDMPINCHGGSGAPAFTMSAQERAVALIEVPFYSHRVLWHLIFAGAFDRYPNLKLVLTEQGTGWIPRTLATLDEFYDRFTTAGGIEQAIAGDVAARMSRRPSEYFATNCYVCASNVRPVELGLRHEVGLDRIMWGADYPHIEGSHPHTQQAGMKVVLADVLLEPLDLEVEKLRKEGHDVVGIVTDVSSFESVCELRDRTIDAFGAVHVVCNNAGVSSGSEGKLWEHHLNDWRWSTDVNVFGVIHGINAFVPFLLEQGEPAHVVNTSSSNGGFVPIATGAVYATTKAAIVTITECLWAQLRSIDALVSASVLYPSTRTPGMLKTGIWRPGANRPDRYARENDTNPDGHDALEPFMKMMEAAGKPVTFAPLEEVADLCLEGIVDDTFWITVPSDAQTASLRARVTSQIEQSPPDYLLQPSLAVAPKAKSGTS